MTETPNGTQGEADASLRVAIAQISSGPDPTDNLRLVREAVEEAARAGARLVVFPEATQCCFGVPLGPVAEPLDGPWASAVAELAEQHGVVVAAGTFRPSVDDRVINTLLVAGPGIRTGYDKIHLYDAFGFAESDTVAPGTEPRSIMVDDVRIGLTLCYDVRFPGLYLTLADGGAQVIIVAASWGAGPGKLEQWQLLVRARALDATAYVLAAGQADPVAAGVERPAGAPTGIGYSAVIAPDGTVHVEAGPGPELLLADLELARVTATRASIPVLANRRY